MADFTDSDLRGSRFAGAALSGARFWNTDLSGARFREVDLSGAVLRGVELVNVEIYGEIENVTVNGEWEHRLYAERDLAALEARG